MQKQTKFKSTPNPKIGDIYHSRSCAVTVHLYNWVSQQPRILVLKRGPNGDSPNLWNLPCGYLDWDETAAEAAFRELWEESRIDLYEEGLNPLNYQPFLVRTEPTINRQNVCLHYHFSIQNWNKTPSFVNCEPNEVTDWKWLTRSDLDKESKKDWAFDHLNLIKKWFPIF